MPTENLTEFVLYITPGFIAMEIYRWRYPAKERSTFAQIASSIIYALVIVSILKWIDEYWLNYTLHSNRAEIPDVRFALALLASGVLVGLLAIGQLSLRNALAKKYPLLEGLVPSPDSIWQSINASENKDWAVVFLEDGSMYLGWISEYRFDPDAEDQDFLLTKAKRVKDDLTEEYPINGIGVYLNTRDVKRIEFVKGRKANTDSKQQSA